MNATTYRRGLTATPTTTGYDLHCSRGQLVGRVQFRKGFSGRWHADCYAYDGQTWRLERRTSPAGLREARDQAHAWTAAVDEHCYAASGDCHA
jgi:hypothetical protein